MTSPREPVLAMDGDIDIVTVAEWRRAAEEFLAANTEGTDVTVDLARVEFIDSSGLAVLVALHTAARERGGKLALVSVPRRIGKALTVVGLDQVFAISPL